MNPTLMPMLMQGKQPPSPELAKLAEEEANRMIQANDLRDPYHHWRETTLDYKGFKAYRRAHMDMTPEERKAGYYEDSQRAIMYLAMCLVSSMSKH